MISSAHLVWLAVDSPRQPGCVDTPGELCWVCAGPADRSVARVDWLGASYTGQNRVKYPAGTRICEPCIFLHSRTSPVPGREAKEGKKFGGNWRNYCVMVEVVEGAPPLLWTATKGEKALVREFLFRVKHGTWFCSIADSGQKHTVPGCPVNPPGTWGRVRFEETDLVIGPNLPALVTSITEILTLGASKEGVETGEHHMLTWGRIPEELQAFEDTWGHRWRGSDLFKLALWLAQRDEERAAEIEAERKAQKAAAQAKAKPSRKGKDKTDVVEQGPRRRPAQADDRPDLGIAGGVPEGGGQHPGPLGSAPDPVPPRREPERGRGVVVQPDQPRDAPRRPGQLTLF